MPEKKVWPRTSYGTLPLESWILHGRVTSDHTHCLSHHDAPIWFLTRTTELWVVIHLVFWAQIFAGSTPVLRDVEIISSLCSEVILIVRWILTHIMVPLSSWIFIVVGFNIMVPESCLFRTSRSRSYHYIVHSAAVGSALCSGNRRTKITSSPWPSGPGSLELHCCECGVLIYWGDLAN